jgi:hypothetical protein
MPKSITLKLDMLFGLLDDALSALDSHEKEDMILSFVNLLDQHCDVDRQDMFRALIEIKRAKEGKRKVVVGTRTVPVSHPEEMGDNGLMWRDSSSS